jgi:hypothetical protein
MLIKDPTKRIVVSDILNHPWVTSFKEIPEVILTKEFDHEILERMRSYKGESLLKKAAMNIFVEFLTPV